MNAIEANAIITQMGRYWPMFKPDPDMAEAWALAMPDESAKDIAEALVAYARHPELGKRPITISDLVAGVKAIEQKRYSRKVQLGREAVEARYEEHYNLAYMFDNRLYAQIGQAIERGESPEPIFATWEENHEGYGWKRKEVTAA